MLGDAPRSVEYWVRRFEERVFSGLMDGEHPGLRPRLDPNHIAVIDDALRKSPNEYGLLGQWDGKTHSLFIRQRWGASLAVRQAHRLFRDLGFRFRKPHPKIAHDDRFSVWAVDEVHFEQHSSTCRTWILQEVACPILLHHPTRKGIGYFGAVRIRDGKFIYCREEESFNRDIFFSFLKKLRRASCHTGCHVVLIPDNVKYPQARLHLDWGGKSREHLSLEFMPAYSPELNPIERVWKLTRRMATHNKDFPTLNAIISSVENVFSQWQTGNDALRRLCAI